MTIKRRDVLLRGGGLTAAALTGAQIASPPAADAQPGTPLVWQHTADVVVIGSGASGTPAAIAAREAGNSVIVIETENHLGGHGICSGGNVPLGGGTSLQKKYGIVDSPELLYRDLTDWSVVESNGFPDYRYNDHEIIRAFADNAAATFEWLIAHGVVFVDKAPDTLGGEAVGNSVPREAHAAVMNWSTVQTGAPLDPSIQTTTSSGNGLLRPLLASAHKLGVQYLMQHRLMALHRESPHAGRILGVAATHDGKSLNVRALKAVVLATGGATSNINWRRMFDPRLTEEYCGVAGTPYSYQDASGEIAGLAVGASLWGMFNQTGEFGDGITKPGSIGSQFGYVNLRWMPGSPVFDKAHATGLHVNDWQDVILVNMLGKRFYDETAPQFSANDFGNVDPYTQGSWRNAKNEKYNPRNFLNAALAGIDDGHNGGGPIWAIFDADAVAREKWDPRPPNTDNTRGFFFQADTLADLANAIKMKYQRLPMSPAVLEATVTRFNSFVDSGVDSDFDRPKPLYKIAKAPFYAAWATPVLHDTRSGLRINGKCQVQDMHGRTIPGLYSCGETAGGFSEHGLARATCQGRIAGLNAAAEPRA
jgi:succinate dehydrogenase/fumarate reductase flavoprotein subunit